MKLIALADIPVERLEQPRTGVFLLQRLLEGVEGTTSNFSLELVRTFGDFFSPRHRHNFDQVRYQIEGAFDYSRGGKLKPGMVGYFPEGTHYGPQTSTEDALQLVLQFAGASGATYLSKAQLGQAVRELKQLGELKDGVFTRIEADGRKTNMDSYEAIWRHVFHAPLAYPPPRYLDPVLMNPEGFAWTPRAGEPGVSDKLLGIFSERRTEIAFLRIAPGAVHRAAAGRVYFVVSGEGRADDRAWQPRATISLAADDAIDFAATTPTEMLVIAFPSLLPGEVSATTH